MKLRVADEVLTILAETALESEQIDKAMAAIAQILIQEENVLVARGGGSKSVQNGIGTSATPGAPS